MKNSIKIKTKPLSIKEMYEIQTNLRVSYWSKLLLLSGLRVQEAVDLAYGYDLDAKKGYFDLHTKGNEENEDSRVHLTDEEIHCIKEIRRHKVIQVRQVQNIVKADGKFIGIEALHPHMFRTSFATYLNSKGINLSLISKLMNHSSIEMTNAYVHLMDAEQKAAKRLVSQLINPNYDDTERAENLVLQEQVKNLLKENEELRSQLKAKSW